MFKLALSCQWLFAQDSKLDSIKLLTKKRDAIEEKRLDADSMHQALNKASNALDSMYQNKADLVGTSTDRIHKTQHPFNERSDSLEHFNKSKLDTLTSQQSRLQKEIDSLTVLKLPLASLQKKLDSLNALRKEMIAAFEKKTQAIKEQVGSKLKELDLPSEAQETMNPLDQKINGISVSLDEKIPRPSDLPSSPLKQDVPGSTDGSSPLQLPPLTKNIEDIYGKDRVNDQLPDATRDVAGVATESKNFGQHSKDAAELAGDNMDNVKNVSKAVEKKAADFSGVKKMEEQTKNLNQYKDITRKAENQEAVKKELKEKAKKVAVDHFSGKEEQLKAAMEKMSKYKQKYSSMNGLKDLSKKRPNAIRDQRLIERIGPGVALQMQKRGRDLLIDFNPYAGYQFTTHIRAGLGWNQRIGYDLVHYSFTPNTRIYGPRAFGELKLGKGFSPRAEFEVMNTNIPPLASPNDAERRQWVCGAFAGIKKEYKLFKNVKGTGMVMARLYNPNHKSPYADVVNVRFGFEFPATSKKNVK